MPITTDSRPIPSKDLGRIRIVRAGIKHAVAGLLAFYWANLLQLPSPSWAVFTVIMLMMAEYVGAVGEKSVLRILGTVAGGFLGIWLVGDFGNSNFLLFLGTFLVVAVGGTLYGGTFFPYVFFLAAITPLIVISDSLRAPELAWTFALHRVLEVCLGISATMLVTNLLWPVYARDEYARTYREALSDLKDLVLADEAEATKGSRERIETAFAKKQTNLRNCIYFGTRESRWFSVRTRLFSALFSELGQLFRASVNLGNFRTQDSRFTTYLGEELSQLRKAMADDFDQLASGSRELVQQQSSLPSAVAAWDEALDRLRQSKVTLGFETEAVLRFAGFYASIKNVAHHLARIRLLLSALPKNSPVTNLTTHSRKTRFSLSPDAVHIGIKGGLAAVLGLFFYQWLNPPGGIGLGISALIFTMMSPTMTRSSGDAGTFLRAGKAALISVAVSLVLLALVPLLSNAITMAAFVGASLFGIGAWIKLRSGASEWTMFWMLTFIGVIGLDPQQPVLPSQIFALGIGTVFGLLISAVVQRTIWPILPHRLVQMKIAQIFETSLVFVNNRSEEAGTAAAERISLLPSETAPWIEVSPFNSELKQNMNSLLRSGHHIGYALRTLSQFTQSSIFDKHHLELKNEIDACWSCLGTVLTELTTCFQVGRAPNVTSDLKTAVQNLETGLMEWRGRLIKEGRPYQPSEIEYIGVLGLFSEAAREFEVCFEIAGNLDFERLRTELVL